MGKAGEPTAGVGQRVTLRGAAAGHVEGTDAG
jgi:hypothetical protein